MTPRALFSRKTTKGLLPLSLLLIFAIVLAACGGSQTQTHVSRPQTPLAINPNNGGDYTRVFNPYNLGTTTYYGSEGLIYETLLFFNRLDGSVKPWLAASYQFSSDATSITFTLRQGVKWSDGQPFTSDDVVFTLNLLKKYPAMDNNGEWTFFKSVSAPDANTVLVTLVKPFTPVLWYLAGQTWILPKHLWSNVGDASQYADPNPVGTGPYLLKSFTPQIYTLVKNPNYWQPGKPVVNELTFPAFDGNTSAELALNRGQLEWAGLYIPNIQQTYVKRDPAHNHYWFPPSDVVILFLNTAKYPFNLLPVRQAISSIGLGKVAMSLPPALLDWYCRHTSITFRLTMPMLPSQWIPANRLSCLKVLASPRGLTVSMLTRMARSSRLPSLSPVGGPTGLPIARSWRVNSRPLA